MIYKMSPLPARLSVDGIYSVLKVDFSQKNGIGEAHDFPELSYTASGMSCGIWDGREVVRHAGQLCMLAPGVFHKKKAPTEGEGWIIAFSSDSPLLASLYHGVIDLDEAGKKEIAEVFSLGLHCFTGAVSVGCEGGTQLSPDADPLILECFKKRLELFLLGLHRRYGRDTTKEKQRENAEIARVRILLSEHIAENLSVEEIARLSGISVSKLKGLFREKSGVLHTFICMKIEHAKRMIEARQMNFSEIADALGFASLHYFSRTFKTVTGVSPSQFSRLL